MINRTLPLCFHPTTFVMVDDDKNLLDSTTSHLTPRFLVKSFTSPLEVLKFFRSYQERPFTEHCFKTKDRFLNLNQNEHFEPQKLYQNLFNEARFQNVSVIISDYSMPSMTGAQLFNELYALDIKKVLFTGEASDEAGIEAFNNGVIDRFCRKSASISTMINIFEDMQLRYFQEKTHHLFSQIDLIQDLLPQCMKNAELTRPILQLFKSKNIVEFYLLDLEGYFLTVTSAGELNWFILHSSDEIDTLYNMLLHLHQDHPSTHSEQLLASLKAAEKTLFFPKNSKSLPLHEPADWHQFALSTESLFTSDGHFYYGFKPVEKDELLLKPFFCFDQANSAKS